MSQEIIEWVIRLPWDMIKKLSFEFKLDPILVAAIIKTESNVNQYAVRYEPNWKYSWNVEHFASRVNCSVPTEAMCQATSWGYMQVMGTVCREQGFQNDPLPKMCDPFLNIWHGCQHIRRKLDEFGSERNAVAAYNAGKPRLTEGGFYYNQKYVDKVYRYHRDLGRLNIKGELNETN